MERRLIRRRWQITIPKEIRQRLNLFEGQLLNFDVVELEGQVFMRIFTGASPDPAEMAAFKDLMARKNREVRKQRCGSKIRKSDDLKEKRAARLADQASGGVASIAGELKAMVSDLSQYLLTLQARL